MILIISDKNDHSTNEVIDWIDNKQREFLRINREDELSINQLELINNKVEFEIKTSFGKFKLSNLKAYWYRRGYLNFNKKENNSYIEKLINNTNLSNSLFGYLNEETNSIRNSIYEQIYQLRGFGKFHENETNKFTNLVKATLVGINVPNSIISNKKSVLKSFLSKVNNLIITKAVDRGGFSHQQIHSYANTQKIEDLDLLEINDGYYYSLLQVNIIKKYELRIFYLDGELFSSAIFSQNDSQTSVDFRNYNRTKPNRLVPFKLGAEIKVKLVAFMKSIDIKSGSIDLVVSKTNNYTFLEVNPIGQFQQVSLPCNYFIERHIAQYLLNIKI
jgi:ATP-GRASP peptide maturase of grasp-with-spasm system